MKSVPESLISDPQAVVEAIAPGKVILFGEHAINRGQPALASSVGLYARCRVSLQPTDGCLLQGSSMQQRASLRSIFALCDSVKKFRSQRDFDSIRQLAKDDYFAPAKYILGCAFEEKLPEGLTVEWTSQIPASSGLGSGGAAFTAMITALVGFLPTATLEQRAEWAHLGDVIA